MDEPLSNLDAKLRSDMRTELQELQADLDVTTVYVTHDQTEAMAMGDRIAVMDGGCSSRSGPGRGVPFAGEPVRRGLHRFAEHQPSRPTSRARPSGAPAGLRTNSTTRNRSQATTASALASARRGHHCRRFRPEHGRCDGRRADGERELPLHGDGRPRTHRPRRSSIRPAEETQVSFDFREAAPTLLFDAQTGDALKTKTDNVDPAVVGATED